MNPIVTIWRDLEATSYPSLAPFHPDCIYPELHRLLSEKAQLVDASNRIYTAVRHLFLQMGLDRDNQETPEWNPLGEIIERGSFVVLKPNLVLDERGNWRNTHCLTTHGAVLRAVADYAWLATGAEGRVWIADAPLQGTNFSRLRHDSGLDALEAFYKNVLNLDFRIVDLRREIAIMDEATSYIHDKLKANGDPLGYHIIDLEGYSRLESITKPHTQFSVVDYDTRMTQTRHASGKHEYVLARTILEADTIISIPKLKTHEKVGITACLKNLIGIIGSKDCLPHFRLGAPEEGDEYPMSGSVLSSTVAKIRRVMQGRVPSIVWKIGRAIGETVTQTYNYVQDKCTLTGGTQSNIRNFVFGGAWYGNDTIWRVTGDLNYILFFADCDGKLHPTPQRRFFAVVDGIIGGENEGPLKPTPRPAGVLVGGTDPVAIDIICATMIGFDWQKIPMLREAIESTVKPRFTSLDDTASNLQINCNDPTWTTLDGLRRYNLGFKPSRGWRGHIELEHL